MRTPAGLNRLRPASLAILVASTLCCDAVAQPVLPPPSAPAATTGTLPDDFARSIELAVTRVEELEGKNTKDANGRSRAVICELVTELTPAQRVTLVERICASGLGPSIESPGLELASFAVLESLAHDGREDLMVRLLATKAIGASACPLVTSLHQWYLDGLTRDGVDALFMAYDTAKPELQAEIAARLGWELCYFFGGDAAASPPSPDRISACRTWYLSHRDTLALNYLVCNSGPFDACEAAALVDLRVVLERLLWSNAGRIVEGSCDLAAMPAAEQPPCLQEISRNASGSSKFKAEMAEARPPQAWRVVSIDRVQRCTGWFYVECRVETATSGGMSAPLPLRALVGQYASQLYIVPDAPDKARE